MTTSKTKDTADNSADDQIVAREQAEQLKALEKKLAEAEAKTQAAEQAKAEAEAKTQAAEQKAARVAALEGELEALGQELEQERNAKAAKAAEVVEPKIITVVSKTEYCYMLEGGVRVTPDAPVRAEWKPGNLLDCNMKAGLIGLYEV